LGHLLALYVTAADEAQRALATLPLAAANLIRLRDHPAGVLSGFWPVVF